MSDKCDASSAPKVEAGPEAIQEKTAKSATFIVTIHYQQNGSWQGTVKWTNERKEQYFRSELELITLIDEAVRAKST